MHGAEHEIVCLINADLLRRLGEVFRLEILNHLTGPDACRHLGVKQLRRPPTEKYRAPTNAVGQARKAERDVAAPRKPPDFGTRDARVDRRRPRGNQPYCGQILDVFAK